MDNEKENSTLSIKSLRRRMKMEGVLLMMKHANKGMFSTKISIEIMTALCCLIDIANEPGITWRDCAHNVIRRLQMALQLDDNESENEKKDKEGDE